jgi:hypothetical protein
MYLALRQRKKYNYGIPVGQVVTSLAKCIVNNISIYIFK